jgi:hypothetical protein
LEFEDIDEARRVLAHIRPGEAASGRGAALRQILDMDTAKLVRLAYRYYGTERFLMKDLAKRSHVKFSSLHGLLGSLGMAERNRGVQVLDRHGEHPHYYSVRAEVADLLTTEADVSPDPVPRRSRASSRTLRSVDGSSRGGSRVGRKEPVRG